MYVCSSWSLTRSSCNQTEPNIRMYSVPLFSSTYPNHMCAVINFSQKQTFLTHTLQTRAKGMYLSTETGLYCIVKPLYVRMYLHFSWQGSCEVGHVPKDIGKAGSDRLRGIRQDVTTGRKEVCDHINNTHPPTSLHSTSSGCTL